MVNVVIAPDSFKGTLDARNVADAIRRGWTRARPQDAMTVIPQADGGEGTMAAIAAVDPDAQLCSCGPVSGPDGRPTPGVWMRLSDGTALIELAQMSGLPLMRTLDPLGATTRGLGEVIRLALDAGVPRAIIGLGGSASTDGGAGALSALGMRMLDSRGRQLADGGGPLVATARIDRAGFRRAPSGGGVLLTDVDAPLLGPLGAAAVFGPQKGADVNQTDILASALSMFSDRLSGGVGADTRGAGAAGGTAFGFLAAWGAEVRSGSEEIAHRTGLNHKIARADIVITGEGRFDSTSHAGKVVGNVLRIAESTAAQPIVIAGQIDRATTTQYASALWAGSLADAAGSVAAAMTDPVRWLEYVAADIAESVSERSALT